MPERIPVHDSWGNRVGTFIPEDGGKTLLLLLLGLILLPGAFFGMGLVLAFFGVLFAYILLSMFTWFKTIQALSEKRYRVMTFYFMVTAVLFGVPTFVMLVQLI